MEESMQTKKFIKMTVMMWFGIAVGNFIWQALRFTHQWNVAFERSFFQIVPIILLIIWVLVESKKE